MKIIVVDKAPLKNNIKIISDESCYIPSRISTDFEYHLVFVDGKITLKFFKKLLFSSIPSVTVEYLNDECFFTCFSEFRDIDIIYKDQHLKNIEDRSMMKNIKIKYKKNSLNNKTNHTPLIFNSIITSLLRPDLYLSDENNKTHQIVKKIKLGETVSECVELSSLIAFGAVIKTSKGYQLTF